MKKGLAISLAAVLLAAAWGVMKAGQAALTVAQARATAALEAAVE